LNFLVQIKGHALPIPFSLLLDDVSDEAVVAAEEVEVEGARVVDEREEEGEGSINPSRDL